MATSSSSSTMEREGIDLVTRDRLLNENLGLVHHVARQLSRRLATEVDFDELVSAGSMGLMNAVDSFDPSRGLAFSTFAAPRIRGAILDELRRQDHVPRSIRRKSREIGAAREALTRQNGLPPEDMEIAAHLGVDLDTLWRWQAEIEGTHQLPLASPINDDDNRSATPAQILSGGPGEKIEDELNHQQEVEFLRDAILRLKEQERIVLSLYYFEELKLHEIATILELTESRVSQIRSKAITKLRAEMGVLRDQLVA